MIRRMLPILIWLLAGPSLAGTIPDMAGREVEAPPHVERIACLEVLCYQKMLMLGAADKVIEMTRTAAPWMAQVHPQVAMVPQISSEVDFEQLLALRTDVAFYAYDANRSAEKLKSLGIAGWQSQPPASSVRTAESYLASYKQAVRMMAAVLGGEAPARAEAYCAWVDERVTRITAVVRTIPPEKRLKLYYLRGPDALTTQGIGSATFWFSTLGGGEVVVKDPSWQGKGQVSMEDLLRWNPDVILVGRQYSPDLVLRDSRFRDIAAVKAGRIYPTPEGVFYWDGGIESVLLMEFVAKRLYPERFPDLDLIAELRDFYHRFYGYELSEAQATLLLAGRSPDGSSANPYNN